MKPRESQGKPWDRECSSGLTDTEEAREARTDTYPLDLARGRPLVTLGTTGWVERSGWKLVSTQ